MKTRKTRKTKNRASDWPYATHNTTLRLFDKLAVAFETFLNATAFFCFPGYGVPSNVKLFYNNMMHPFIITFLKYLSYFCKVLKNAVLGGTEKFSDNKGYRNFFLVLWGCCLIGTPTPQWNFFPMTTSHNLVGIGLSGFRTRVQRPL